MRRIGLLFLAAGVLAATALTLDSCARRDPEAEAVKLHALAERYFQARFDFRPTAATAAGDHSRDRKLEDFSQLRVQFEQVSLRAFLDTLATAIDSTALPPAEQIDYAIEQVVKAVENIPIIGWFVKWIVGMVQTFMSLLIIGVLMALEQVSKRPRRLGWSQGIPSRSSFRFPSLTGIVFARRAA